MNELASRLRAQPENDLSLAVGAVALGVGSTLSFNRMQDSWADFPLLLLLAVPCAVLFVLALAPGQTGDTVGARADGRLANWQTACLLTAIPLLGASIAQLLGVLGEDDPGTGTATWILLATVLCAVYVSARFQSPGATLLAALLFVAASMTAVNWIDSDAEIAVYRDVLLADGALFLLLARSQWDARHADAKLLVALAGAALIAGALFGGVVVSAEAFPFGFELEGDDGWELVLIVVSIGVLAFAAWQRHGGSAFVGLVGLAIFLGFTANGDLSGWPLVLGLLALACLAWALVVRPSRQAAASPPPPQPPPT